MKFAAFIMTFERENILLNTINTIFSQTFPPEEILIVDNSKTTNTATSIQNLNNPKVKYYRVGANLGPAGAAAIGLQILADQGYDWIYWGDDDDPPIFEDTFEILLRIAQREPNCGCVGSVGQFFNKKTGFIKRVSDQALRSDGVMAIDNIAGNMSKIVNGQMIRKDKILPVTKLFFGFEELDFDLRIAQKGYKLLVDKSLYLKHREKAGKINFKRTYLVKKDTSSFQRNYYSIRNLLYITYENSLYLAFLFQLLIAIIKPFYNLKYGFSYFKKSFYLSYSSVFDFFRGNYGLKKIF